MSVYTRGEKPKSRIIAQSATDIVQESQTIFFAEITDK